MRNPGKPMRRRLRVAVIVVVVIFVAMLVLYSNGLLGNAAVAGSA